MKSRGAVYTQKQKKILEHLGMNIRLARLRRKLSAASVAERAGIAVSTMSNVEKGNPGVSIGTYLQVLSVLQLAEDLLLIAENDIQGRRLQDMNLITRKRAPKEKKEESPISHVIDNGHSVKPNIE